LTGIEEFKGLNLGVDLTDREKDFIESFERLPDDDKSLIVKMMKKLLNER